MTIRIIRSLLVLCAVLLLTTPLALAGPEIPPLIGHLIDGTGQIDQAGFEQAVDPLVKLGTIPLGIAYNGSGELPYNFYEAQVLQSHGYGVPAESLPNFPGATPLDPDVVAIAIDYGGRNISIYVGTNQETKLDQNAQDKILDSVAQYAIEDPNRAFEAGFATTRDILDPPLGRAFRFTLAISPFAVGLLLLIALAIWTFKKLGRVSRANHDINLVRERWQQLTDSFAGGRRLQQSIVALLSDFRDEADRWEKSLRQPQVAMDQLAHELDRLSAIRLGLTSPEATITESLNAYNQCLAHFKAVEDWIVAVHNESEKLESQVSGARDLALQIEPEIDRVRGWYEQACGSSKTLPRKEQVFGGLTADLDAAKQLIFYQSNGQLRGARILENIRILLIALEKAAALVVEAENTGLTTISTSQVLLEKWITELPTVDQFYAFPLNLLSKAVALLTDDSNYDDVVEPATRAKENFASLGTAAKDLSATLTLRDANKARLESLFGRGYRSQVENLLLVANEALKKALRAIQSGAWQECGNELAYCRTQLESAYTRMDHLVDLQSTNTKRLADLSIQTAAAEKRRTTEIAPLWSTLHHDFTRPNYEEIADHFKLATQLIAALFDNPADERDTASQVNDLNGMEEQRFEEAEKLLNELFRQLEQALGLLDGVANRHALCLKARDTHVEALTGARTRRDQAVTYRDEHNRDIAPGVDESLRVINRLITEGETAAKARYFVLALARADSAASLAIQTLDSAKGQVSRLTQLRQQSDTAAATAAADVARAEKAIGQEHDSVVRSGTDSLLRDANNQLAHARLTRSGSSVLEDTKLATALETATHEFTEASRLAKAALTSLGEDQDSYNRLLSDAASAINKASEAIKAAATKCDDHRSGQSGNGALASAHSLLPDTPRHGSTRSAIKDAISAAQSAEERANTALAQAKAAIRRYEEEEAAKKAAEEARQQAAERERKRQLQAAASVTRTSSHSSSSFSSSSRSTHTAPRNTGGSSSHRKF